VATILILLIVLSKATSGLIEPQTTKIFY